MRIVLLPGMDGTGDLFKPLLEHLSKDIAVEIIAYPADKKISYNKLIDYVTAKLPYDDNYLIVAESFSGPIAFAIAKNPPPNLKSVIFVCSFLKPPRKVLTLSNFIPLSVVFALPVPLWIIKRYLLGNVVSDELVHLFRKSVSSVNKTVLSFRIRQTSGLAMTKGTVALPCVYIQATNDRLVPPGSVKKFREVISKLEVIKVPGPHFILQANPVKCAHLIENKYRLWVTV